jgi:hypothetical protein
MVVVLRSSNITKHLYLQSPAPTDLMDLESLPSASPKPSRSRKLSWPAWTQSTTIPDTPPHGHRQNNGHQQNNGPPQQYQNSALPQCPLPISKTRTSFSVLSKINSSNDTKWGPNRETACWRIRRPWRTCVVALCL